jgi:hypothetical protein
MEWAIQRIVIRGLYIAVGNVINSTQLKALWNIIGEIHKYYDKTCAFNSIYHYVYCLICLIWSTVAR